MDTEVDHSGLTERLLVPILVLAVFAATAVEAAIFAPAKATLAYAVVPFFIALVLARRRSVPELLFAALQIGYATWYLPLLFHTYVTEAALLEAMAFLMATVWFFARPSPWPILYLALYHSYSSVVFINELKQLISGLSLREVPWARVYLANILTRVEFVALACVVMFTSEELHVRTQFWLDVIDRGTKYLSPLNSLPDWCDRQVRRAFEKP